MSKSDTPTSKKERNKTVRWVVTIFLVTICVSALITLASDMLMEGSSMIIAFLILLVIVFVGIIFDVVGMAVATADEKPFHSMAARRVRGAQESIRLLRKAERVSSICNDVVGDICGVVSGTAAATIAAQLLARMETFAWPQLISLAMSALVAGLTVGGKAIGKTYAINSCTKIVHSVGKIIWFLSHIPTLLKKKKKS